MNVERLKEKIYHNYKALKEAKEVKINQDPIAKKTASPQALTEEVGVEITNPTQHAIKWRSKGH
ncbi:hypothetical protein [Vagococcus intermedius]|uniref:Uncharacterized protein n=1 Tax=Vagococcus intermedius TaxID=2991418 RepID=A0AAF0CWQ3_9ENTE|nr:hypothetical protein [Vagococcus intermedius]WEG74107.1 hypothetical protein OL234_04220 [Vagococcus intermedius]WEG76187.1 hypothetical protein OL235_04225 [Vagococcus intermedius]